MAIIQPRLLHTSKTSTKALKTSAKPHKTQPSSKTSTRATTSSLSSSATESSNAGESPTIATSSTTTDTAPTLAPATDYIANVSLLSSSSIPTSLTSLTSLTHTSSVTSSLAPELPSLESASQSPSSQASGAVIGGTVAGAVFVFGLIFLAIRRRRAQIGTIHDMRHFSMRSVLRGSAQPSRHKGYDNWDASSLRQLSLGPNQGLEYGLTVMESRESRESRAASLFAEHDREQARPQEMESRAASFSAEYDREQVYGSRPQTMDQIDPYRASPLFIDLEKTDTVVGFPPAIAAGIQNQYPRYEPQLSLPYPSHELDDTANANYPQKPLPVIGRSPALHPRPPIPAAFVFPLPPGREEGDESEHPHGEEEEEEDEYGRAY